MTAPGIRLLVPQLAAALLVAAPARSWADAGAASATSAGMAGAAASPAGRVPPDAPPEVFGMELTDWTDPRTGSSAALRSGCGYVFELHLSRSGTRAFLDVHLANRSSETSWLASDRVTVRFADGRVRRPSPIVPGDPSLKRGWSVHRTFELPTKEDLRGQDSLSVELPIVNEHDHVCVVRATLVRPPGVPTDARTYTRYDWLELYVGGGARLAQTHGLADIADAGGADLDFGVAVFPWAHHGFFFDIGVEGYGSRGVRKVAPDLTLGENPHVIGAGFFVGYAFRLRPTPWLSATLGPSIGPYFLDVGDGAKDGPTREQGVLAVRSKLRLGVRFARSSDGAEFWLAPTLVHLLVPSASFGPADVSGQTLGAMLELVMGG